MIYSIDKSPLSVFIYEVNKTSFRLRWLNRVIYYINTNEIPSELSRENFISSHVKITCYLHM